MNEITLVGRIKDIKQTRAEKKRVILTIGVSRSFKNTDGIYEIDLVPCVLYEPFASNTLEYCHNGDVVGIKGRIQTTNNQLEIIASKVTFLSSPKREEEQHD